jgi:ferritin-like metal-binding protein YciE
MKGCEFQMNTRIQASESQLVHFLSDMYSVEQQALAQLISAPKLAGDATLAEAFRQHYMETEQQAKMVRERLEAHDGSASAIKDAVMKLGGKGFLLFAWLQPETPGRLIDHAYSYEAMEWAGYEMLRRLAETVGDTETAVVAKAIGAQEREMMERLERGFDAAEQASHAKTPAENMSERVRTHLAEVHAFESQMVELLKRSETVGGDASLHSSSTA